MGLGAVPLPATLDKNKTRHATVRLLKFFRRVYHCYGSKWEAYKAQKPEWDVDDLLRGANVTLNEFSESIMTKG